MVTLEKSQNYTSYALQSFFKNTKMDANDEFLLINNDNKSVDEFSSYRNIEIKKNEYPLSFAKNVNQAIDKAIKVKKNLIFLNNDVLFTKNWIEPLELDSEGISIPINNQLFPYESDCEKLKLRPTMNIKDFNDNFLLLDEIVKKHQEKYKNVKKFQALLMPFFCFKIPYKILKEVGFFDTTFVNGAEDVDYRVRCTLKGHDVNFLINSYLLHFHGKSTWDGGETASQMEKRNELYTEAFRKKWGDDMTQIFIVRENFFDILKNKKLNDFFEKKQFSELIKKLLK